jgi:hypothetical protein
MQLALGSYTGDGTDNRQITGIGFQPDLVIMRARDSGQYAVWRSSTMSGDKTAYFAQAAALFANAIQSLDSDGFTVGTHATVNSNGVTYDWQAFKDNGVPDFKVGTFTGDGTDNRDITALGFDPDFVTIKRDGLWYGRWRTSSNSGDQAVSFTDDGDQSNEIQAFVTDGFQVGTGQNANGAPYHWFAFKAVAGASGYGSYAGNNADDRSINGVGFQPDLVWVKGNSSLARGASRPSSIAGDTTVFFTSAAAAANHVQALESDGFQVGTSQNASGYTYRWFAWKSGETVAEKSSSDSAAGTDSAVMAIAKSSSDSGTSTEAGAHEDAPHGTDEGFGDDRVADREFGAAQAGVAGEAGSVAAAQTGGDAATGTDSTAVGQARADAGAATDSASVFPQTAAVLLEAEVINRLTDQVRFDVEVFYERIASAVLLGATVMPLLVTPVQIAVSVINQEFRDAAAGDLIAPAAQIDFI